MPDILKNKYLRRDSVITIAAASLSALITFLVYLPALKNGFVDWDDQAYIYGNPYIRSIDLRFIKWAFTAVVNANWHPLTVISYALDYSVWGLNPFGYHLTSIIFHCLNTFMVFILTVYLVRLATNTGGPADKAKLDLSGPDAGTLFTALLTSLLFGLHPLHVESVAWASERKDVLSGFFFLSSAASYLRYAASPQKRPLYYAAALVFFILALLSKPMAITLPAVFLILDYYPLERLSLKGGLKTLKTAIVEKIPFFALSLLSAALTFWAQGRGQAVVSLEVAPLSERLDIATRGFVFYIKKMALPVDLAPFYVRPMEHEFYNHVFAVSLAIFLLISLVSLLWRKRIFSAAWLYYVVTLLPVIGIVQVSDQAAADRYFYLPSIGLFLLISFAAAYYLKRHPRHIAPVVSVIILVFAVMTILTLKQIAVWKDSVALWSQEIRIFPTVQAYTKRADAYYKQGSFMEAIRDYNIVMANTDDRSSGLYLKRGAAYLDAGYAARAINDFNGALAIDPQNMPAYFFRGNAHRKLGDNAGAIKDYQRALELSPENPVIYLNLGLAYSEAGNSELSAQYIRKAAALGSIEALNYLN